MTSHGKHEIKINLGTANYNKHKNKGYTFCEFINNSKENSGSPNSSKIKINYVPEENILTCVDDGISMRHNLTKCFDISRQTGFSIYHNWGEGLNDSIGSLIKDGDPRSMVYIFTWKDKSVDIGCMFSSALLGPTAYAILHHISNIHLIVDTNSLVEDIKKFEDNKMTRQDNQYSRYQDFNEIIEKAKKYCKLTAGDSGTISGTAIEIYYPDIIVDDENNIMCETGGQTLNQFLTDRYLPQNEDQKICNFSDMFGEVWKNKKFDIYINGKHNPPRTYKLPGIGENPSEIFTLYKEGTFEEIGKLQILQSIRMSSNQTGWFQKFKKCKEPDQHGKYYFLFNDMVVSQYRGDIRSATFDNKNTGYPTFFFKQKYDDSNIKRATSIYKNITKNISNVEAVLNDEEKLEHPLTDQIIDYDNLLKFCDKAAEMAEIADPVARKPTLEAPLEKFLMRFSLLPYNVYILPKDPKINFGRTKEHFKPTDELLQAAKFCIGKWAYQKEIARFIEADLPENSVTQNRVSNIPSNIVNTSESDKSQDIPMSNKNAQQIVSTPVANTTTRPRTRQCVINTGEELADNTLINMPSVTPDGNQNKKKRKIKPPINWMNKKLKILEYINEATKVNLPDTNKKQDIKKKKVLQNLKDVLTKIFNYNHDEESWNLIDSFNKKFLTD